MVMFSANDDSEIRAKRKKEIFSQSVSYVKVEIEIRARQIHKI